MKFIIAKKLIINLKIIYFYIYLNIKKIFYFKLKFI